MSQVYTVDFSVRFKTLMFQTPVKLSRLLSAILLSLYWPFQPCVLGLFVNVKENERFRIRLLQPCSQQFIFLITYECAQSVRVLHYYTKMERLARVKHSSLSDPFVSYKENKEL